MKRNGQYSLTYIPPPLLLSGRSPAYLPSSLCWAESGVLLVGKGHLVKVREERGRMGREGRVEEREGREDVTVTHCR